MEMIDQPTAPAEETSHRAERCHLGCDYVALSCDFGPTRERTIVYADLETPDINGRVTLPPRCFKLCRKVLSCEGTLYAAGPQCRAEFLPVLVQELTACDGAFFTACRPGFTRVGRVCNFLPAEMASEFYELELTNTVASLQGQIDVLKAALKIE